MNRLGVALMLLIAVVATGSTPMASGAVQAASTVTFTGRGNSVTGLFPLDEGLVIATFTHTGVSNFIVHALDSSGEDTLYLANGIGAVSGAREADGARFSRSYLLDVRADGDWSITLEQPRPASAPSAPQTYTGAGQSVSPFVFLRQGVVTVRSSHSGPSNFIVDLLDAEGSYAGLAANEIGSFTNSARAITVRDTGVYLLDIRARGSWSITVEQTTTAPTSTPTRTPVGGGPSATPTRTPTPVPPVLTPTPTPRPQPSCTPRPRVQVSVTRSGPTQLHVSISATGANNYLSQLRFGQASNARISVSGQTGAGNFTVNTPGFPTTAALTVERHEAGQPVHVPLVVVDGCGNWSTFVGAGVGAH